MVDESIRPVVFSSSSVAAYLRCHLEWWFTHVAAERGEAGEKRDTGISVHQYAEHRLRDEPPPPVPHWQRPLADVFDRDILPTYGKVVLVEAAFQLEINGIPYSGVLDSVDDHYDDDPILGYWARLLRDLKSTGSRPRPTGPLSLHTGPWPSGYRFNMVGYFLGAQDLGFEPTAMRLDYIVRTKTPYYWPEDQELPDDEELDTFAAILERVANGVARADYQPTGLGTWACKACAHNKVCGPYQRYKEIEGA